MQKVSVYSDYPESVLLGRESLEKCQSWVDFGKACWIRYKISIRLRVPACTVINV